MMREKEGKKGREKVLLGVSNITINFGSSFIRLRR
jgi:hypothetical protein